MRAKLVVVLVKFLVECAHKAVDEVVYEIEFILFADVLEMVNIEVEGDILFSSVVDCVGAGVLSFDGFAEAVVEGLEGGHFGCGWDVFGWKRLCGFFRPAEEGELEMCICFWVV